MSLKEIIFFFVVIIINFINISAIFDEKHSFESKLQLVNFNISAFFFKNAITN